MAKSENGQENNAPDHSLTATLLVKENSEDAGEIIPSGSQAIQLESSCEQTSSVVDDEDVPADSTDLYEAAVDAKRHKVPKVNSRLSRADLHSSPLPTVIKPTYCSRNVDVSSSRSVTVSSKTISSLLQPRGLCNLGNTCFFNSVLQCLARTPYLLELLLEIEEPGQQAAIPLDEDEKLYCTLIGWGPVTEALALTMRQITEQSGNAFSPVHLLDALRRKHSQFQGYNQHDSHELLRTLLDCVKTEDSRRYQTHVLKHFGLSNKTDPREVDDEKRKKARELNKRLADTVHIRPDPVFKGTTISRNQCTKCSYKSEIPESFLDLSLPVSFSRLQSMPVARRRDDFGERSERLKSKHQRKKEKQAARKNKKFARMKKRHDDDRNKNIENVITDTKDFNESGYSSGKTSSPVQNNGNLVSSDNSKEILAEALKEIKNGTKEDNLSNASVKMNSSADSLSSDTVYNDTAAPFSDVAVESSSVTENAETTEKYNKDEVASSEMRFCLVGPVNDVSKLTNSAKSSSSDEDKEEEDDADEDDENDAPGSDDDVSADENIFDAAELKARKQCATLQPPTEDEDNSIQACLREYTKCEILTDNNKVNCERCTKEHEKKTGEKKNIYQTFSKELLIKSPPPVLILHLKRFESKGAFSFRKVEKHIIFPLLLDIGSFCSAPCERLLHPEQKNIVYSLYGIVEHSGSLNAGHYVAYVKVRKTAKKNGYRKLFLPKDTSDDDCEPVKKENFNEVLKEHQKGEHQWYYISDSSVRHISEQDVLRKQAYLLFYERIW